MLNENENSMICQRYNFGFTRLQRSTICGGFILVALLVMLSAPSPAIAWQETGDRPAAEEEDLLQLRWAKMNPTGARAVFEMPMMPRFVERTFTPVRGKPPIKVRKHIGTTKNGAYSFVFNYSDLHERPRGRGGVDKTLEGAVQASIVNVNGQIVNEVEVIKLPKQNVPGRQFVFVFSDKNGNEYIVISRVFLKGRRQYQLSAIGPRKDFDEQVASRFLNSFNAVRPKPDMPPVPKIR
jgi:hypothetical protein